MFLTGEAFSQFSHSRKPLIEKILNQNTLTFLPPVIHEIMCVLQETLSILNQPPLPSEMFITLIILEQALSLELQLYLPMWSTIKKKMYLQITIKIQKMMRWSSLTRCCKMRKKQISSFQMTRVILIYYTKVQTQTKSKDKCLKSLLWMLKTFECSRTKVSYQFIKLIYH